MTDKAKVLERLFYDTIGDKELYTEHDDSAASNRFSSSLQKLGLDFPTRNELEEQLANAENEAERHGFEQGFRLALRLTAELIAAK